MFLLMCKYRHMIKKETKMTDRFNPTENQTQKQTIQPNDIKALIQKQGKAKIGNQEFTLQQPAATDRELQNIINDPSLSVRAINHSNGQAEYELSAKGRSVKIKIGVKTIN